MNVYDYVEPEREATAEVKISKSRFIGQVRICRNPDEARSKLRGINAVHRQATHNCWAYRIGLNEALEEYFSDDGEPSGTAGKPIAGAIARRGLTNTLVVVTRYFGGVKLGVRGLIEAYGSTATAALSAAGEAGRVLCKRYRVIAPYETVRTLERLVQGGGSGDGAADWSYGERVEVRCSIPCSESAAFEGSLEELLRMKAVFTWEIMEE